MRNFLNAAGNVCAPIANGIARPGYRIDRARWPESRGLELRVT